MKHIIDTTDLKNTGRPIGKVADEKLLAYITEAEQLYVKPVLGHELFLKVTSDAITDERILTLLNGGNYNTHNSNCDCKVRTFMGLKVAMSYFVYAKNLMLGDIESTRFGNVVKNGDFSTHISSKERSDAYNNTMEVANTYLKECVEYCMETELIKSAGHAKCSVGGITIRKIGK